MYARLLVTPTAPTSRTQPDTARSYTDTVRSHPGYAGLFLLRLVGSPQGSAFSLWSTREDALAAEERSQAVLGPPPFRLSFDSVFEIVAERPGRAHGSAPAIAHITWFDGPRGKAQAAADELAERRIGPAIEPIEGVVRTYVLRGEGNARVVVALTTGVEVVESAVDAILATELLPGEDPALLAGPDRSEVYRVVMSDLALAPSV